jgi:hypothetical protein
MQAAIRTDRLTHKIKKRVMAETIVVKVKGCLLVVVMLARASRKMSSELELEASLNAGWTFIIASKVDHFIKTLLNLNHKLRYGLKRIGRF